MARARFLFVLLVLSFSSPGSSEDASASAKRRCPAGRAASFRSQPTAMQVKSNKVKISWRGAVRNMACLQEVRVQYTECERGGESGFRVRTYGSGQLPNYRPSLKMPVLPGGCYRYVVELISRGDRGSRPKTWSQPITVNAVRNPPLRSEEGRESNEV